MFILTHPARAQRLGLFNEKANLSGLTADWAGLLTFLAQIVAVGDLLLFSFIMTWIFGARPPTARCATSWRFRSLAPHRLRQVHRGDRWSAATNIWLAGTVLVSRGRWDCPAKTHVVMHGLSVTAIAAVLMLLVTTPVALIACAGRGYLPRWQRGWGAGPRPGSGRARLGGDSPRPFRPSPQGSSPAPASPHPVSSSRCSPGWPRSSAQSHGGEADGRGCDRTRPRE